MNFIRYVAIIVFAFLGAITTQSQTFAAARPATPTQKNLTTITAGAARCVKTVSKFAWHGLHNIVNRATSAVLASERWDKLCQKIQNFAETTVQEAPRYFDKSNSITMPGSSAEGIVELIMTDKKNRTSYVPVIILCALLLTPMLLNSHEFHYEQFKSQFDFCNESKKFSMCCRFVGTRNDNIQCCVYDHSSQQPACGVMQFDSATRHDAYNATRLEIFDINSCPAEKNKRESLIKEELRKYKTMPKAFIDYQALGYKLSPESLPRFFTTLRQLAENTNKWGITTTIKIFRGPFPRMSVYNYENSCTIALSDRWISSYKTSEIFGAFAHEFGHLFNVYVPCDEIDCKYYNNEIRADRAAIMLGHGPGLANALTKRDKIAQTLHPSEVPPHYKHDEETTQISTLHQHLPARFRVPMIDHDTKKYEALRKKLRDRLKVKQDH